MDDGAGDELPGGWAAGDPESDDGTPLNGHQPGTREPALEPEAPAAGWVSAGGVMRWEPGEAEDGAPDQAGPPLAADAFAVPEGAPDAPRVGAVRAWLLRKREMAGEEMGALLLRQRAAHQDEPPADRRPRRGPPPPQAAGLELAEQQAALDEYTLLAETLDETEAHSGLARTLVEYYLWLAEHLDGLTAVSRELMAAAAPDPLAVAAWNGRAQAVVATRGRVERMMAPAADD